jgi:hypothetical protein
MMNELTYFKEAVYKDRVTPVLIDRHREANEAEMEGHIKIRLKD